MPSADLLIGIRKYRSSFIRNAVWAATLCGVADASVAGAVALNRQIPFEIPAQALETSLLEFSRQAQVSVLIDSNAVADIHAPAVKGTLPPGQALAYLLANSGLSYSTVGNTITVSSGAPALAHESAAHERNPLRQGFRVDEGAAGGGDQVQEVVVTATKREERLIDAPLSVTVLSADKFAQSGASQFRDFADKVPGLSYHSSGPGVNQITLRGVSVGSDVSATVGIYVDDVPYGSSSSFARGGNIGLDSGLFDLDRLEVLKGPQGTLYGASTMGGLIKYVTRQPDPERFSTDTQAGVSGTEHGGVNYNAAAAVNIPVVDGKVAVRVSGYKAHDGGYIDNVLLGKDSVNSSDIYGGRLDVLFPLTAALSVRLNGFLQDTETDGFPLADFTRSGAPVNGSLEQSRILPESFNARFRLGSATLTYDLGFGSLTSISSYQISRSDMYADLTTRLGGAARSVLGPSIVAVGLNDQQKTDKFTQEIRFASTERRTLEWVLGAYYTHEESENHQDLTPYNASGAIPASTFFTFFVPSKFEEIAGFGDLTWHLTDKFDVTGGLRYAENEQSFEQIGSGALGTSGPRSNSLENTVTYLANARYHFTENATAYARYATGYRPGGPNFLVRDPVTGQQIGTTTFRPDSLKSYESGFKADIAGGLLGIDLSAFYIEWSDIQVIVTRGGLAATDNAPGGADIRGAELSLTTRPTAGFTAQAAFSYQNPKFSNAVPALGAADGERLSGVPRFTTTVLGDYQLPLGTLKPTVGATVHYQAEATNGYGAAAPSRLPSFTTVDLRTGLSFDRFNLQLYVRNVSDERGQVPVRIMFYSPAVGPIQRNMIQPRTIGIQATAKF